MSVLKALPILMYHHVSPAPGLVTVSPTTFRAQMAALADAGWRSAGLVEVEAFFAGQALPPKTCVISFDDGYLDNFVHAHPVLCEFGLRAVLFIVTGWLGDGPVRSGTPATPNHRDCKRLIAEGAADQVILRWSEAEAMAAAGSFEFHSHTHSHTRWDKSIADLPTRREALAQDLATSKATLQSRLGLTSRHLCWPQGYYDADYQSVAQAAGFDHLYTTEPRVNRPGSTDRIGRIVTKEKPGPWVRRRAELYASPTLGGLYNWLKGR